MRIVGALALMAAGVVIAWGAISGTLARAIAALVNPAWVGWTAAGPAGPPPGMPPPGAGGY